MAIWQPSGRAGQQPSMQSLNKITQIYKCTAYTEALAALASGTSSRGVRFGGNFDAGTPWSAAEVDALVENHSKLDVDEWVETYFDRADHPMFVDPEKGYQTVPPYLKFFDHFLQNVVIDRALPYRVCIDNNPYVPDTNWEDDDD